MRLWQEITQKTGWRLLWVEAGLIRGRVSKVRRSWGKMYEVHLGHRLGVLRVWPCWKGRASGSLSGAWSHPHASLLGHAADGRLRGKRKASAWASTGCKLVMVLGLLALGLAFQLGWRWLLGLGFGLGPNKNKIIIKKIKIK